MRNFTHVKFRVLQEKNTKAFDSSIWITRGLNENEYVLA